MKMYSIEVPGTGNEPGKGAIRRSPCEWLSPLGMNGVSTLYETFQHGVAIGKDQPCLGYRPIDASGAAGPFQWITYGEVNTRAERFASGLANLGLAPVNAEGLKVIGFCAKNRPEWVVGEQACYRQGYVPVPMYASYGADGIEYVVKQVGLKAVCCSALEFDRMLEVHNRFEQLSTIVLMQNRVTPQQKEQADNAGVTVYAFPDVESIGAKNMVPPTPPCPKDIAFFCYTSGTTGDPKGALISHEGIMSCMASIAQTSLDIETTDVYLSYLPLPHVMERSVQTAIYYGGGRVGFYQGDPLKIMEDLQTLHPTIFVSVPRLLNRVYDKIMQGVDAQGGMKAKLFYKGLAAKVSGLKNGSFTHPFWDRLVFNGVKSKVGLDRVRMMMTGSAPIAAHVMEFLRCVFGVRVLEGYGQTESSTVISITHMDDVTTGHVGPPLPCNDVRLIDVPEMQYLVTDTVHGPKGKAPMKCLGRGEILFRGPNVFQGYYNMPEKTASAIDDDGWCHTGDIGLWQEDGNLKIIDRKKNIFKLSQGEYVAPEKVENVMGQCPFVAMSFVYGDSLQSKLVAIVVPDADYLLPWAEKNGHSGTVEELCANAKVKDIILKDIVKFGRLAKLSGFELPKAIHLEANPFTPDNGILTPTFKLKRPNARDKYSDVIDALYASLDQGPKSKL